MRPLSSQMSKQKQENEISSRVDALERGQREIIERIDSLAGILHRIVPSGASCASSSNGKGADGSINVRYVVTDLAVLAALDDDAKIGERKMPW